MDRNAPLGRSREQDGIVVARARAQSRQLVGAKVPAVQHLPPVWPGRAPKQHTDAAMVLSQRNHGLRPWVKSASKVLARCSRPEWRFMTASRRRAVVIVRCSATWSGCQRSPGRRSDVCRDWENRRRCSARRPRMTGRRSPVKYSCRFSGNPPRPAIWSSISCNRCRELAAHRSGPVRR